jgi:uncharacterized protein with GYD domain
MARFAMLLKFTDKGLAHVKESPARAAAFKSAIGRAGGSVESLFWLTGDHDGLVVFSAPEEGTATAIALNLGALGNVRTCVCRAFDEAEFKSILAKM